MDRIYNDIPYGLVHKNVMKDNTLSIHAKAIYSYLCVYAGSTCRSFPSRDLITHELNISKDTFTKYMKELKDSKYIHVYQEKQEAGKFAKNVYYMTPDRKPPCHKIPDTVKPDTETPDTVKPDTKNNNPKNNNIKSNIYIDLNAEYVKLTQIQYDDLVKEYGETTVKKYIEKVDLYAPNRKTPYKNYKSAILTFIKNDIEKGILKTTTTPPSNNYDNYYD